LTSVDCWEELLEPPEEDLIARAHGNWIGRLALVSLCAQLNYSVAVLPAGCCSGCLEGQPVLGNLWDAFIIEQGIDAELRPLAMIM